MSTAKSDIVTWELVLKRMVDSHSDDFLYLENKDWSEIISKADPEIHEEYGEDAYHYAMEAFHDVAGHLSIGSLNLNFQQSLHGDACWVDIYRLPEGTSMIMKGATFELEGSTSLVCRAKLEVKTIIETAKELLLDSCIDGEIHNADESSCVNPDVNMVYSGESELISNW